MPRAIPDMTMNNMPNFRAGTMANGDSTSIVSSIFSPLILHPTSTPSRVTPTRGRATTLAVEKVGSAKPHTARFLMNMVALARMIPDEAAPNSFQFFLTMPHSEAVVASELTNPPSRPENRTPLVGP